MLLKLSRNIGKVILCSQVLWATACEDDKAKEEPKTFPSVYFTGQIMPTIDDTRFVSDKLVINSDGQQHTADVPKGETSVNLFETLKATGLMAFYAYAQTGDQTIATNKDEEVFKLPTLDLLGEAASQETLIAAIDTTKVASFLTLSREGISGSTVLASAYNQGIVQIAPDASS